MRDPLNLPDNLAFILALQRKDHRDRVTYRELEQSLPKDVRKIVADDWQAFIRAADGEQFALPYEKTIAKNFPGMYRLIEACEYLFEWAFHRAAAWLFGVEKPKADDDANRAAAFDFADRLREFRAAERKRLEAAAQNRREAEATALATSPPKSPTSAGEAQPIFCFVCGEQTTLTDLASHFRKAHRSWREIADQEQARHKIQIARRIRVAPPSAPRPVATISLPRPATVSPPAFEIIPVQPGKWEHLSSAERNAAGLCFYCDHPPMPGEFTCYHCRPE